MAEALCLQGGGPLNAGVCPRRVLAGVFHDLPAPPEPPPEIEGERIDGYVKVQKIGSGGRGDAWKEFNLIRGMSDPRRIIVERLRRRHPSHRGHHWQDQRRMR